MILANRALGGSPERGARGLVSAALALAWVAVAAGSSRGAAEVEVEFFSRSFVPQSVTVDPGDTVVWLWRRGTHRIVSGQGPSDPKAGTLFDRPLDEEHPVQRLPITQRVRDGFTYFDGLHPGVVGFVDVAGGEETVRVAVVDNVFQPDVVEIFTGDSVRWEHEPGEARHTVTSGHSSRPEHRPGELFDAESTDADPIFVFRFDRAGLQPYFCRPHEALGMTGEVRVQDLFVRADATGEGRIDLSDAVATLDFLFRGGARRACEDALDANDDGRIDLSDPITTLSWLFLGGTAPPAPFAAAGADRSEDDLRCWPEGGGEGRLRAGVPGGAGG